MAIAHAEFADVKIIFTFEIGVLINGFGVKKVSAPAFEYEKEKRDRR